MFVLFLNWGLRYLTYAKIKGYFEFEFYATTQAIKN
jgi:hypothetical protein